MSKRSQWLVVFGVWTVLGLLAAAQHLAFFAYADRPFSTTVVVGRTMLDWYTCGVFTPLIFHVAHRFRLDRPDWLRALPVHILACALFIIAKLAIFLPLARGLGWVQERIVISEWLYGDSFALTLAYASVVGASYAYDYYVSTTRLESRLARVQLDALRSQLHPHFLFNALNALSTLVHRDAAAADRMILELSELLRRGLAEDTAAEVTLDSELEFVRRYVGIMQIRFGDRLNVVYDVAPDTLDALVPNMVLQPLVENALVHGIGRITGPGELLIRAHAGDGMLTLQVRDNGPGLNGGLRAERVGLRNTRMLLQQLYGEKHSIEIANCQPAGVMTRVALPFHREAVSV